MRIKRWILRIAAHLDYPLLLLLFSLMLLSLFVQYSAAGEDNSRLLAHGVNMLVALAVMVMVANTPPQYLLALAVPLYTIGVVLLVGVALFGDVVNGSRRWLHIGVTRIQPSEIMKIAMPLMLAWYFHYHEATLRLKDYGIGAILLAIPVALVARQPDLGTALLISASGFYVLFFAGLPWRIMAGMAVAAAASMPVLWHFLHDYQKRRVLTLLDPSQDPLGAGYHIIQSTIAIGSGGGFGKGWLNGTQSHLDFLPEHTTDFVFAVFGEEFGLLGNILLLLLYLAIIARGLTIAASAPTLFARLMAGSVTLAFFTYAFVNMGMVSGILPVVGIPLPMMSYGGTAMVIVMLGFGILMSVKTHRKLLKS
ncbi:rod shape-determining protein RodA [Sulfuriferula sp. AH1]|uniref:rod shape-determining protein RodA n=1 Tax=Sulfuriferula sp. AH1 TaxID=1985873 RepID=UPI000B3B75A4|nr:rod shape-determining protein RodA [Sulfuriferula sp. AH1]ARU32408.1 rod shape-determining protein RodA [Sulfuriferula sp. AH1]